MNLLQRLLRSGLEKRYSVDEYLQDAYFSYMGNQYSIGGYATTANQAYEKVENSFTGYIQGAYKSDGIVFACMLARLMIFSEARFLWQHMDNGRPGDLHHTSELGVLERPWSNGTTGELLARMEQDTSLSGNFYAVRERNRLRRLRPDWVSIILTAPPGQAVQSDVAGYLYRPGGSGSQTEGTLYLPEQVCHWSPIPDPDAQYRGMSWLTPVIREVMSDKAATKHKQQFFDNGATLNAIVSLKETVTETQFKKFVEAMNDTHRGVDNAYKTMFVGGGADVTLAGADMKQLDFKNTQGAGETRIAAASGIHPVIVGLSEGLAGSSLNQGNFNAARRLTADKNMRPLWRSASAALETVVRVPDESRLWWDESGIAFLRDDQKDVAEIQGKQAMVLRQLADAGANWDAAVEFLATDDIKKLLGEHSGLFSVQLQPPNTTASEDDEPSEGDE